MSLGSVEAAKQSDYDVVGLEAEFLTNAVPSGLIEFEFFSINASVDKPEAAPGRTHFLKEVVGHMAIGDHNGIGHICMEPAVEGVTSWRPLVASGADKLEAKAEKFEQPPQKKAFTPVTIDDVGTVRPE